MGMYTLFHMGVVLKEDTPDAVINTLRLMLGEEPSAAVTDHPLFGLKPHALFKTDRWMWMLQSNSYYFEHATIHAPLERDEITRKWPLTFVCNLKNYADEIELFVDWISPYLDTEPGEFMGYYLYEEDDMPTLLFAPGVSIEVEAKRDENSEQD